MLYLVMPTFYKTKHRKSNPVHIVTQGDIADFIYKPKKFECHRVASIMAHHLNEDICDNTSKSYLMFHCGEFLKMDTPFMKSTGEIFFNRTRLTQANFCRNRFCPMCQYRLSRKTGLNLSKCIKVLHDCKKSFLFLTLTMPNINGDDLNDAIKCLNKGWSIFYHTKDVQCVFRGYFKALEVTYNQINDTYHPHLHLLVDVNKKYFKSDSYLNHEQIVEIWMNSLNKAIDKVNNENISNLKRDDFYMVNIKRVKDDPENFKRSVLELSKYISKSNDITELTFDTFYNQLSHVRSYEYIGDFRIVYRTLHLNDDIIDEEIDNENIGHILACFSFDYESMSYSLKYGGQVPDQDETESKEASQNHFIRYKKI